MGKKIKGIVDHTEFQISLEETCLSIETLVIAFVSSCQTYLNLEVGSDVVETMSALNSHFVAECPVSF